MDEIRFIRLPAVMQLRGRGRASTYTDVRAGLLTEPVELGSGSVGWPEHEIQAINRARLAGKSVQEIRDLVAALHSARKVAA